MHSPPPTLVLDVEGVLFKTRLSTLQSVKGNYFDHILARDWQRELDRDGHLFVDRDSSIFPIILNFLREGSQIALPQDEFYLARILQEARFFRLYDLCDIIERKMSYGELPLRKPTAQAGRNITKSVKFKKSKQMFEVTETGKTLAPPTPSTPIPVFSDYSRRLSSDTPPMPMKKSTLEKKSKKTKVIESISLPRNFAHVAHVGWNGSGVIFSEHLLGTEETVRAIIDAAGEADLTPVYNVLSGEDAQYGSHSVEVILAGPHMQTVDPSSSSDKQDLYSKPQKRPPRPAPKPPMSERPASK